MIEILKVLILGIVEGITEFLPISSTGHLILTHEFVKLEPEIFSNAFDVIIQLGAIMSVVVIYFNKLNPFSGKNTMDKKEYRKKHNYTMRLWVKVIVGVIPAAVLGLLFDDYIDEHFFNPTVVAIALVVWGLVIIYIESNKDKRNIKYDNFDEISLLKAFQIGCFQCLALIPGTSRSAATIIGATLLGTSRTIAAEFSFFLAIPTMLGATLLKIVKNGTAFSFNQWMLILVGAIVSFIVALIVINKFMDYIKKHDFKVFGYYRVLLGGIILLYFLVFAR